MPKKKKQHVAGYRPGKNIWYNGSTEPYHDTFIAGGTDVCLNMDHIDPDILLMLCRSRTLIPVMADEPEPEPSALEEPGPPAQEETIDG